MHNSTLRLTMQHIWSRLYKINYESNARALIIIHLLAI